MKDKSHRMQWHKFLVEAMKILLLILILLHLAQKEKAFLGRSLHKWKRNNQTKQIDLLGRRAIISSSTIQKKDQRKYKMQLK